MKLTWKKINTVVCVAVMAGLISTSSLASQKAVNANLSISIKALKEKAYVTPEGKRKVSWVEPKKVVPGDEVVYAITYKNMGKQPTDDVVITNLIPQHMQFRPGSARTSKAEVKYSVDGGRSFKKPADLKVRTADGRVRRASSSDYTHIQWRLKQPLSPGKHGVLGYRATLK